MRFVYHVPSKSVRRLELRFRVVSPVIPVLENEVRRLELRLRVARDDMPVPLKNGSLFPLRVRDVSPVIPVPVKVVSFELENVRDVREVFSLTLSESKFVNQVPVNPFEVRRLLLILSVVRFPHQVQLNEVN